MTFVNKIHYYLFIYLFITEFTFFIYLASSSLFY